MLDGGGLLRQAVLVAVPATHADEHDDGQQGGQRKPGHALLPMRQHDPRGQQRPGGGARIAPHLEDGLRQTVASARGHAGYARRLRVEDRGAGAHHGRGQQQDGEGRRHRQREQPGQGAAHAHCQRVGLGIFVGVVTHQRLQQRGGELIGKGDQTDLGEIQVEIGLEQRIDRQNQRLDHVVEEMRKADRSEDAKAGLLRRGVVSRGECSGGGGGTHGLDLCGSAGKRKNSLNLRERKDSAARRYLHRQGIFQYLSGARIQGAA